MESALVQKLATYHPQPSTTGLIKATSILLLVGPTGAGKDALKDKLLANGNFHHIISHTTRPPRINHGVVEQDGREYHFINQAQAEKMLIQRAFIEAKIYSDNLYGTSVAEIQAAHDEGKVAMTDLEVQGVAEYKAINPKVVAVFLLPPSFKVWQTRLKKRYGDVVDVIDMKLRMQTALQEINQLLKTNYFVALVNDDLEKTFLEIQTLMRHGTPSRPSQTQARAVAAQLAKDIETYLAESHIK